MRIIILLVFLFSLGFSQTFYNYYVSANAAEEIKDYNQAINYYQAAIKLEPRFAPAHNGLGFVYLELADYKKAREYLAVASNLMPEYTLPIINIGASYYREGNLSEAQYYFLKVLDLDPKNVRALTNMAVVKFKYGDYWGAYSYYLAAKGQDENYLKERYNKEKSLQEIAKARKLDPANAQLKILEETIKQNEIFLP